MKKMLLIIQSNGEIGGAQKRFLNLSRFLGEDFLIVINYVLFKNYSDKGLININNLIVLNYDKQNFNKTIRSKHKQVLEKNRKRSTFKNIKGFIYDLKNWLKFIKEISPLINEYNIKLIHTLALGGIWVWPLKYLYRFKLGYSFMDSGFSLIRPGILNIFRSENLLLKHVDYIDFLSEDLLLRLKKIKKIRKKISLFISPNSFIDYEQYFPEYPKDNSVVFLSRLEEIKNPLVFLEAIKIFNSLYYDISRKTKFIIVGFGTLTYKVIQYIEDEKLYNTFYYGQTYNSEDFLRKSIIFVSIQRQTNYPSQVLIEAMACENAIIASDVGDTRKIVTDKEGILVNIVPIEISEAIYKLLRDKSLTQRLGVAARRKVLSTHTLNNFLDYFYSITKTS